MSLRRPTRQSGQSATEFAVLTLVLVPLFLFITYLGKYADMNYSAVKASRYLAWERTVSTPDHKSEEALQNELRKRLFTNTIVQFQTGDVPDENNRAERHPLWVSHGGERLLASYSDVAAGTENQDTPGGGAGALNGLVRFLNTIGGAWSGDDPDLEKRGLYRGDVRVRVADVAHLEPLDSLGLVIARHNVILADGWDARSPGHAEERVRAFTLGRIFFEELKVDEVTQRLGQFPFTQELMTFQPGYIDPEVVPNDRLGDKQKQ